MFGLFTSSKPHNPATSGLHDTNTQPDNNPPNHTTPPPPPPHRHHSHPHNHNTSASLKDKALLILNEAAAADAAQRSQRALQLYQAGVDDLIASIRLVDDPHEQATLRRTATECLSRAEALKAALKASHGAPSATTRTYKAAAGARAALAKAAAGPRAAPAKTAARATPAKAAASTTPPANPVAARFDELVSVERPSVRWEDVAGLESAKQALQEAIVLPMRQPTLFTGARKPWRGILLFGPPGTGKSHLAKAVASQVDASFFSVSSSDLVSKWVGESEQQVRGLFEAAVRHKPSIIFIDECDALGTLRTEGESDATRRLKNELLVRMSSAPEGVLVLGATNVPWELDPAMRRRFERRVYVPLPDATAREALLRTHLGATPHSLSDADLRSLSRRTEGLSGADVSVLVRDALMSPLREMQEGTHFRKTSAGTWEPCDRGVRGAKPMSLMQVPPHELAQPLCSFAHFESALTRTRPSVSRDEIKRHERFDREYGAG